MKKLCLLIAMSFAPAALAAFKCVDEKGLTHVGDTPPAACASVVMYEVSKTGMVLRRIDPSLTPEQIRAKTEETERRKAADIAAAEQNRKDLSLMNSFSSEREFDVTRDRNIEPLRARIASASERLRAIDERKAKIDEEMEFYKAGKGKSSTKSRDEPPPMLVHENQRLDAERKTLANAVIGYEREIEQVRVKFETDKKRWLAIKAGDVPTPKAPGQGTQDSRSVKKGY
jgi:Domain of unknown function (DUF4124)